MNKVKLLNLYFIFLKVGAILLGGGYVILPILINELVEKRNLIKQDELIDFFALSQSLPGIIAANISMFVGYKLRGFWGAVIAMLGIISAPFVCIVLLASILSKLTANLFIQGVFWGVGVAVIALILLTIKEVWQKSNREMFFYTIFLLSLVSLLFLDFSPIKTIIVFSLVGILIKKISSSKEAV